MSLLAAHEETKRADGRRLAPAVRTTSSTTWRWFLALEAVFALVYFPFGVPSGKPPILGFIPWMEWSGQVPAWALLGLSAVAAITYGIRRYRPNAPIAWWFLGGGVLLFITGDTTYKVWHQLMGQQNIPFPSFIDAIYIAMYPVLAVGLLLLARARVPGGDRASLLDSLTITLGVGLLSWIFLIGPNVRAPGGMLVRLTAAAYPLGDILVLAMLAHLWSAGGLRNTAGRLLAIGTAGTLVSDSLYGLTNLHPSWHWSDGNPVDLGWILFYACWGAAALHPSMRTLSEPRPAGSPRTGRARLALLAVASLVAPAVLLVEAALGNPIDTPVIAVVAAVMFLLVLMRMAGLVQAHQQAMTRERVLRKAAAELVAAPGNAGIYHATIAAVSALVSGHGDIVGVTLAVSSPAGGLTVAAQSGEAATEKQLNLMALRADVRDTLSEGKVARCAMEASGASTGPGDQESLEQVLMCPLVAKDQLKGLIAVTSAGVLPVELTNTIETLAAQVGLALDREALTETFHARRSEARFQTLVQNASDVILIARPDTTITYQTPSAKSILGYEPGSLEGERLTMLLHPDDVEQALAVYTAVAFRAGTSVTAEWRVRHRNGSWRHVEVVANNLLGDPTVEGVVLTMRDVSERKGLEEELKHQAFHDALSGLANRALFRDRLEHASARAARSLTSLAVLFLDLDDFKLVNDSLGHAAGDEMLVAVAGRLLGSLRAADTAARFGGDEFAVLLEDTGPEAACRLAERIIDELRVPLTIADREVQVRASIGIALSPAGAEDPAELLQAADVAMYAAKGRGKGRYEVYQPALQAVITERLERTAELQQAVDQREFVIYYQPIVNLDGNTTVGVEALVRWRHPERGLLLPMEFIPIAEETGLIIPLGRWVLKEACRQARQWQLDHGLAGRLRISVNISARHFQHDGLVEDVSTALEAGGLDPESLVLEITESVLVQDADSVVARMLELKLLGVSFAIDDFGTGYSSLSYLKRFPIDILKVDKSFVDGVGESPEKGALAEAIVQLGNTLHLQTIAEGIEETRQVDGLRALGCQFGQGFYFAKPLPVEEIDELLSGLSSSELSPEAAMLNGEALG
ncbi:MAG: EAL domain-containing protein [Acidimicrobiales bacterium]|jgi:diguanylate cyclase (GGDEF)-like protein/PAS domain S-box-containing protein